MKKVYVEARKKDGSQYSKSTLTTVRFGSCRFIKSKSQDLEVIKDDEANLIFHAKTVELERMGPPKVEHKPSISNEDLRKLYDCCEDPKGLQSKVWFEMMLFSCRRGRENLQELQKDRFSFGEDSSGRRYICKLKDELTKNRRIDNEAQEGCSDV